MEGLTRIELASSVWKTEALPLSYSPESGGLLPEFVFNCGAVIVLRMRQEPMRQPPCSGISKSLQGLVG